MGGGENPKGNEEVWESREMSSLVFTPLAFGSISRRRASPGPDLRHHTCSRRRRTYRRRGPSQYFRDRTCQACVGALASREEGTVSNSDKAPGVVGLDLVHFAEALAVLALVVVGRAEQ